MNGANLYLRILEIDGDFTIEMHSGEKYIGNILGSSFNVNNITGETIYTNVKPISFTIDLNKVKSIY